MLIAFHKPYGVVSQFTRESERFRTLADFGFPNKGVYSLGRLDADSEGLLLLSDESGLNHRLLSPQANHSRVYWAQVEGIPQPEEIKKLTHGVRIQQYQTLPCIARLLDPPPAVPPRTPPIRERKKIPTAWIELQLTEGKNRQVRRMTAAVGHPTLRLIRVQIGGLKLGPLPPGAWRELTGIERGLLWS